MKRLSPSLILAAALAGAPCVVEAQTITQWNFNSTVPDATVATGSTTPSTGAGSLTLVGGTTSTFSSGSPGDPANTGTDNTGLQTTAYPAQGTGTGTAGVQFAVNTLGFTGPLQISLDFRQSGTTSRYFQLQLSTNGTTFTNASGGTGAVANPNPGTTATNTLTNFDNSGLYINNTSGTQNFVDGISYTLPANSVYANNANFAFRWVAVYDVSGTAPNQYIGSNAGTAAAYSTTGTARFDDVTVGIVPEPPTYALVGAAGVGLLALARHRRAARA